MSRRAVYPARVRALDHATRRLPQPWRGLLDWVVTVGLAVAFVLAFQAEVAKPYRIPSSSMEPTLHCAHPAAWCRGTMSDRVIANRLAYRFREPRRGEIVVFRAPQRTEAVCGAGGVFVKRLVGLPGEHISIRRGSVFVDGRRLREPYIASPNEDPETGSWTVPAGHYFFLGDNRAHSCDSRAWGAVPRDDLIGPIAARYWPPNRVGRSS
jgi:signal peptidase I